MGIKVVVESLKKEMLCVLKGGKFNYKVFVGRIYEILKEVMRLDFDLFRNSWGKFFDYFK